MLKPRKKMLERLHFILWVCVGESTQDSDRIVALLRLLFIVVVIVIGILCVFLTLPHLGLGILFGKPSSHIKLQ